MGVERFDVLLRNATTGVPVKREWNRDELLGSVAWLKRMNAKGNNIYVRPSGEHGLVLLDSLMAENLISMRSKGFAPAISVEVNNNEFQAWVKLSDQAIPERIRRMAEGGLASAFGASLGNVVLDGYGSLAGCVNHVDPDPFARGKYVLAHLGSVEIGKQAKAYIEHVVKSLQERRREQEPYLVQRVQEPMKSPLRDR